MEASNLDPSSGVRNAPTHQPSRGTGGSDPNQNEALVDEGPDGFDFFEVSPDSNRQLLITKE